MNDNEIKPLKAEQWYAIYTKPRAEKKVEERLKQKNIEVYLPLKISVRYWSDRKKKIKIPLISGIIFVFVVEKDLPLVLEDFGVLRVLKHDKKPAVIKAYEINNLKILLGDPDAVFEEIEMDYVEGDAVQVIQGQFKGIVGTCIRFQGQCRIVIEINALGKKIQLHIPLSYIEKIY